MGRGLPWASKRDTCFGVLRSLEGRRTFGRPGTRADAQNSGPAGKFDVRSAQGRIELPAHCGA
jgi:hypothetical protein